jgi:hypothetical protein
MLAKAGAAAIGALIDAAKIVIGVMVLIALIGWAKTHPDQAQALVTNAMNTAVALLNKLFTWVATLGDN